MNVVIHDDICHHWRVWIMAYNRIWPSLAAFIVCFLICIALGDDGEASDLSSSITTPQVADHISYIEAQRRAWEMTYYPYFGPEFFREYTPHDFIPGSYAMPFASFYENPADSVFRLSSISGMQWMPFKKNWTETVSYLNASSSLRVHQNGIWITPQNAAALA